MGATFVAITKRFSKMLMKPGQLLILQAQLHSTLSEPKQLYQLWRFHAGYI